MSMIFLQCSDTRILDKATPEPAHAFDDNGDNHDDNGGKAKLQDLMIWAHQTRDGFYADLDE